ncbi:hypothetical protein LguiB_007761 [Lonicera macranthoides]
MLVRAASFIVRIDKMITRMPSGNALIQSAVNSLLLLLKLAFESHDIVAVLKTLLPPYVQVLTVDNASKIKPKRLTALSPPCARPQEDGLNQSNHIAQTQKKLAFESHDIVAVLKTLLPPYVQVLTVDNASKIKPKRLTALSPPCARPQEDGLNQSNHIAQTQKLIDDATTSSACRYMTKTVRYGTWYMEMDAWNCRITSSPSVHTNAAATRILSLALSSSPRLEWRKHKPLNIYV